MTNAAGSAVKSAANAAANALGLPTLSNLRNLVIRAAKVIIGMALIVVGTVKLLHIDQTVEKVAPAVAKAAVIA